jgi:hypothetical protein
MPRNTATAPSHCPRTTPAVVTISGSAPIADLASSRIECALTVPLPRIVYSYMKTRATSTTCSTRPFRHGDATASTGSDCTATPVDASRRSTHVVARSHSHHVILSSHRSITLRRGNRITASSNRSITPTQCDCVTRPPGNSATQSLGRAVIASPNHSMTA